MSALQSDAQDLGFAGADWYEVSLAGFNYVDDQCAVYFNSLFAFNRRTAAVKSGLMAFDKTSAAIMDITGVATVTMSAISQVFGLAGSMTDVVAGTFLYDLPPANTQRFVDKNMTEYKIAISGHRNAIDSPASAYAAIRGYLNLCLPVTIEGQLIDRISDTKPQATARSAGPNIVIDVSPSNTLLSSVNEPLPPIPPPPSTKRGLNDFENDVDPEVWRAVQQAICTKPDGDPGATTHLAIADFFIGYGEADPDITTRGIGRQQMDVLMRAVNDAAGQSCKARGVADAKAAGKRV